MNTDDKYDGFYQIRLNVYVNQENFVGPQNCTFLNLTILNSMTLNPEPPEFADLIDVIEIIANQTKNF